MDEPQPVAQPLQDVRPVITEADVDRVMEIFPDLVRDDLRIFMQQRAYRWPMVVHLIALEQIKLPRRSIEQIHDVSANLDKTPPKTRKSLKAKLAPIEMSKWRKFLLEELQRRLAANYEKHIVSGNEFLNDLRKTGTPAYKYIKELCSRLYVKSIELLLDYGITADCGLLACTLLNFFTDDETTEEVISLFQKMVRQAKQPLFRRRIDEEAKIRETLERSRKGGVNPAAPPTITSLSRNVPDSLKEIIGFLVEALNQQSNFTCVICADDKPESTALGCASIDGSDGECHKFCAECIVEYGKASISEPNIAEGGLGLKCMDPGCKQVLLHAAVMRCFPEVEKKTRRLLEKRLVSAALIASGVQAEECQFCTYAEIIEDPPEVNKVFNCEKCKAKFCRLCKGIWSQHVGKKCEEMKKLDDEKEKWKHELEEELSKISIRYCAVCKIPFEKVEGCNKMTCRCGRLQCYLCHAQIKDYSHFCNHVRDPKNPTVCPANCTKCLLWVNPKHQEKVAIKRVLESYQGKVDDETLAKMKAHVNL